MYEVKATNLYLLMSDTNTLYDTYILSTEIGMVKHPFCLSTYIFECHQVMCHIPLSDNYGYITLTHTLVYIFKALHPAKINRFPDYDLGAKFPESPRGNV